MSEIKTFKIVVMSEGEFESDPEDYKATIEVARAYCDGISSGANRYGGSCSAYALPDDLDVFWDEEVKRYRDWDQTDQYFDKKVERREAATKLLVQLGIEIPRG